MNGTSHITQYKTTMLLTSHGVYTIPLYLIVLIGRLEKIQLNISANELKKIELNIKELSKL